MRPEVLRLRATIDPHSPPITGRLVRSPAPSPQTLATLPLTKYRTSGVVSNMPEFQKAFSCKQGSRTALENRCRIRQATE